MLRIKLPSLWIFQIRLKYVVSIYSLFEISVVRLRRGNPDTCFAGNRINELSAGLSRVFVEATLDTTGALFPCPIGSARAVC